MQLLREIIGLPPNLPHSSTTPPIWQNHLCEYSFDVTGDENDIPNWFNHQRDGNLISFSIGPEFPTIALCSAFGIQDSDCDFDYYVFVSINGSERTFERKVIHTDSSFGHLCISCIPQRSLQELFRDLQLTDRNHVEILCETFTSYTRDIAAPIVERIAVHVECDCPPPYRFDLGSSSVAQPVTPQVKRKSKKIKRKVRPRFGKLFKQQFPLFKKRKRKVMV